MPGQQPGWHALRPDFAQRVVDSAPTGAPDLVLDFGAGTGALTLPLADSGRRVVAVELNGRRARRLSTRTAGRPSVTVVHGDMLAVPLPRRPFAVVANPPFAGSWALLRRVLGDPTLRLVWARIVLDERVVRCITSEDGSHANEVRRWRRRYRIVAGLPIPRHAFRPAPSVGARLLVIDRADTLRRRWDSTPPGRSGAEARTTYSSARRSSSA